MLTPEQPQNQTLTPDSSLLLSAEDLAVKQAKWQQEGYDDNDIMIMTKMMEELSEIQDFERSVITKGEEYWKQHPEEFKEVEQEMKGHEVARKLIWNKREQIRGEMFRRTGRSLEVPEIEEDQIKEMNDFLADTWVNSWNLNKDKLPKFIASQVLPKDIDYIRAAKTPDQERVGEYSLNPEMAGLNFEKAGAFIPDLSALAGKKQYEVFKYVVDTYGSKYYIPGLEFWKWAVANPDKAERLEPRLKDGGNYCFTGSLICDSDDDEAYWGVPFICWDKDGCNFNTVALDSEWFAGDNVLLLEK